jgi:hypothetical protein
VLVVRAEQLTHLRILPVLHSTQPATRCNSKRTGLERMSWGMCCDEKVCALAVAAPLSAAVAAQRVADSGDAVAAASGG